MGLFYVCAFLSMLASGCIYLDSIMPFLIHFQRFTQKKIKIIHFQICAYVFMYVRMRVLIFLYLLNVNVLYFASLTLCF